MVSNSEIRTFKLLPATISKLSKELNVYPGSASKITEKLIKNGLAKKQRRGKHVIINKEQTMHAQKLEEIIKTFPRLPLEQILTHSNLTLISLLNYSLNAEELRDIIGVTRQWIYKTIKQLSLYGIILKNTDGYTINPIHQHLQEFARYYYEYKNYQYLTKLTDDALIVWQHGNEFLFKTKKEINTYHITAVTAFSQYNLPLLSDSKYYFYSTRTFGTADIILHTILINPQSKTYNTYACLLYEQTKPSNIVKKARLYNLTNHIRVLLSYMKSRETNEDFLPTWEEYVSIAEQYGVR